MTRQRDPLSKRIGIIIIGILMIAGTVLGMVTVIFGIQHPETDSSTIATNKAMEEYEKQAEEYEKQVKEERKNLRALDGYDDKVSAFDADSVKELTVETLKEGDGATIGEGDTVKVNYTGWMPDGTIIDSTKKNGSDASPASLSLSSVITGWSEGLTGKKVGGVYLLTIPSDKAYGESGATGIPANTPLKFIVEVISIEKS